MAKKLTKLKRICMIALTSLAITACSVSIDGNQYQTIEPAFNLEQFFTGKVRAWGIVQNRSGDVVQRFIVDIDGSIQDEWLVLDETFTYGVGEGPEKRIWTIEQVGPNLYSGSAGDIAGLAEGRSFGNAFNFRYEMDLPVDDTEYRVKFDDWFWAFDDQTMMNRSYIKKFGIVMAEVTIFMQKQQS